jgi:SAM-dependent methyltransferase
MFAVWVAVILWHFPWAVDSPLNREDAMRELYTMSYAQDTNTTVKLTEMARAATVAAESWHIRERVAQFVADHHLEHARVLEIGSGTGKLQDVVADFTGLDIAPTAARFYHKPFVVGTATAMPFKDGEFDATWSIWVLEHISNPEAALNEIRRVIKPGGFVYLQPAWDCEPWAADGYEARPYSDFGLYGKMVKASIPIRKSRLFRASHTIPIHLMRFHGNGPRRLRYRRLTPNYREYWQADSDAVNSLDMFEVKRWFTSRGDEILRSNNDALEIRIRKPS